MNILNDIRTHYSHIDHKGINMRYDSIQLEAHWFAEGEFWNIGANAYNGGDYPVSLEVDPHCISNVDEDGEQKIYEKLLMLARMFQTIRNDNSFSRVVTILINGSEWTTLKTKVVVVASIKQDNDGNLTDDLEYFTVVNQKCSPMREITGGAQLLQDNPNSVFGDRVAAYYGGSYRDYDLNIAVVQSGSLEGMS